MRYKIRHLTTYDYDFPVDNYQGIFCLRPLNQSNQRCDFFELNVDPVPHAIEFRKDYFSNTKHYFSLHEAHKELKVTATSEVEVTYQHAPFINNITCIEARNLFADNPHLKLELLQYILPSRYTGSNEEVNAFAKSCLIENETLWESAKRLCQKIYSEFEFKSGFSTINTPIKTILKEKKGVCQDFTHLAIASLRSQGLAAKYVSGYLETTPPLGKEKLVGSDASHAWFTVYIPNMGWCEFDPTNNLIPSDRHIRTGFGRDYADVSPIKGIYFGVGEQKIKVEVDVTRIS